MKNTAVEHIGTHSGLILPPCPIRVSPCLPCIHGSLDTIATTKLTYTLYPDTTEILAKYSLTTSIWENDSLLMDSILNAFNDSIKHTSLGRLMAIDTNITNGFYDTAGVVPPGIDTLYLANLLYEIDTITPASNIDSNLKLAVHTYLQVLLYQADTLSGTQISALQTLANKCPYQDGPGVYEARGLLAEYNNQALTVYTDECSSGGGMHKPTKRKNTQQDSNKLMNINIYPNPNNGNFILTYYLGNQSSGNVILFNILGEQVCEYALNSNKGEMSISNPYLGNGVYIYKVFTKNNVVKVGRIIIVK